MPVTRPAVERLTASGWYERHPNDRVAYDQLAAVQPWPWAPDLFRVERDVVEPRLEEAVLTGRDAQRGDGRGARRSDEARVTPRSRWHPWAMLAPTLALLVVFFIVPIGVAAYESLFSWDLLTPPRFVGAANYARPGRARRAPAHRPADARLQRARRRRARCRSASRWRSWSIVRARFFASCARASSARTSSAGSPSPCSGWASSTAAAARCSGDPSLWRLAGPAALRRHLEARRVRDDPLSRRSAGGAAIAARGRGARRRRRVGALPPRDAPAPRCRPRRSSRRRRSSRASRPSTWSGS